MDIKAIRDAIKSELAGIAGLHCYDTIPDSPKSPAAVVVPDDPFIDYQQAMRGGQVEVYFKITLLTSTASTRGGQDVLDAMLSAGAGMTSSVIDALGSQALGEVAAGAFVVTEARDYGQTTIDQTTFWKADLHITLLTSRS